MFFIFSCCISSWNGRCCEFPLDYDEAVKPEDANHHQNWFSIQVTTSKPQFLPIHRPSLNQFDYSSILYNRLRDSLRSKSHTRIRSLPINSQKDKWWATFKWFSNVLDHLIMLWMFTNVDRMLLKPKHYETIYDC